LDRLAPIRQIIQVAALLGRVFDADLLTEVSQQTLEEVQQALRDLTDAELVYPRRDPHRESYEFKHALVQDAAISTLLRNQRAHLHRRIATALVKLRADAVDQNPELLALHLQQAGDWAGALEQWQKAGAAAMSRAASKEAVSHFGNAIDSSKKIHDVSGGAERLTRLHVAMATAVMQAEGYRSAKLGLVHEDARLIAAKAGSAELECEVLLSHASYFYATGRNRDFLTLADAQFESNATKLPLAYRSGLLTTKGIAHYNRGEPQLALSAFEKANELNRGIGPSHRILLGGADQSIATQLYLVRSLVLLGRFDEAVEFAKSFVKTIDQIKKPFDLAWAILVRCDLNLLLNNYGLILEDAERLIKICERHGYTARKANGLLLRGLARFRMGELELAIADTREGMLIWRGPGVVFHTPERTISLCELLVHAGRFDEASQLIDDLDELVNGTDEGSFSAECLRVRGQIAAGRDDLSDAIRLLEKAIIVSKQQGALLFELRAATQLALVLARQGQGNEAATRLKNTIDLFQAQHEIFDLVAGRTALSTMV
jgi:tetratricopeptide (TPR) repeat protein